MSLRARMKRLEASTAERRRFPFLFIDVDGRCYAGGRETTEEAWQAEYGDEIEQERAAGRLVGLDFRCRDEKVSPTETAPKAHLAPKDGVCR